ncbi:hypothetical protein [Streptomyces sp. NPDC052015]|uniref:hypothetical protein n=1 Tax=Streptomyces sp. NPDC052015 TaxID=3154755 RepID=UPI0034372F7D
MGERSTAFRAAVSSASSLDAQVPTCPEWTLFDPVQHLGGGTAAGPPPSPRGLPPLPRPRPLRRPRPGRARPAGRVGRVDEAVAERAPRGWPVPSPGTRSRRSRCTLTTPRSP